MKSSRKKPQLVTKQRKWKEMISTKMKIGDRKVCLQQHMLSALRKESQLRIIRRLKISLEGFAQQYLEPVESYMESKHYFCCTYIRSDGH